MAPPSRSSSRYRRRILGLGALATGMLYVIGAPIFNNRIESDLERRVPAALLAGGFGSVMASFSGQDGTLRCGEPLDDPEGARAAAYDVRGVRAIELDRSCRVNAGDGATPDTVAPPASGETTDSPDDASGDDALVTVPTTEPPTTTESDLATIVDIVAANPDLAFLSVLLSEAEFARSAEAFTLFAPSNAAFNEIPADVLARLQSDPDLLVQVLRHHAVTGAVRSRDLVDGDLIAMDGKPIVVATGQPTTVSGASLVGVDIEASNGVVHVIDRVLFPPDIDLSDDQPLAAAAATLANGTLTLTGVVASEVERQSLVAAAVESAGLGAVVDQLTVDPDLGLDAATATQLSSLVRAMPPNLVGGESGFNGSVLYANGVYLTEAGRDAFAAVAAAVAVEAQLQPPPDATEQDAVDLEAQLNAFVAENPILFQPSSAVLTPSAFGVIDRVARDAQRFRGVTITVEGHTDSDGIAIENLQLSQNRAQAVRAALIERGLAAASVEAFGFGSERPVLVNGVEDKTASRRVEFRVVTTS